MNQRQQKIVVHVKPKRRIAA